MPHLSFRSSGVAGLAGAVLALVGCGGGSSGASSGGSAADGALQIRLTTDRSTYALGETVNFTLTMTNVTAQTVPFDMCAYPNEAAPIASTDDIQRNGQEVWADGGNGCAQMTASFKPHEVRVHTGSWNQTDDNGFAVPAGLYTIQSTILGGTVSSTGVESPVEPTSNVVTFTINH